MRNVQVIDGAINCTFPIFQFTDEQFAMIFPGNGQDIAFAEELEQQLSEEDLNAAFKGVWDRPIAKVDAMGIHGTLFYAFQDKKHFFPATRRECDWDDAGLNSAQRALNARRRAGI
jgi:hypothetical protein